MLNMNMKAMSMNMSNEEIEQWFIKAYQLASKSPDESNQNGAVLIGADGKVLSAGFNRWTRGFEPLPEHLERPRKYRFIVHAEQGAVLGVNATGATLICPWLACAECAKNIVGSGVSHVIGHAQRMATTPDRWKDDVADGNLILDAAGVHRVYIDHSFGLSFTIKVNGEDWRP